MTKTPWDYESPRVELVEVRSERGFAITIKPGPGSKEDELAGDTEGEIQLDD